MSTFNNISALKKEFNDEKSINVEEFQSEYASKRTEIVKEFEVREVLLNKQEEQRLALEKQKEEQEAESKRIKEENLRKEAEIESNKKAEEERIQAENNRLEAERQSLQIEKDNLLKEKRITALQNIGFDDDLVLDLKHCKIIFPLEDILCSEEEFQDVFNNTKYQIENPPTPEVQNNTQEADYEETPVMDIEVITDDTIFLVELNEQQKIMQTLLLDFCDYCLTKHGHVDQEYIIEFLTKE
ncbi:hypothetical protein GOQ24_14205 [Myroides sp. LoEW2-1]|nr:hypothetical protein [Myroides sp. LoEW2-1]